MTCYEPSNCEDCIAAQDGLDSCRWNIDDNFCFNVWDYPNVYDNTAKYSNECPNDTNSLSSALTKVFVIGAIVLVILFCIICGITLYICRCTKFRNNEDENIATPAQYSSVPQQQQTQHADTEGAEPAPEEEYNDVEGQ